MVVCVMHSDDVIARVTAVLAASFPALEALAGDNLKGQPRLKLCVPNAKHGSVAGCVGCGSNPIQTCVQNLPRYEASKRTSTKHPKYNKFISPNIRLQTRFSRGVFSLPCGRQLQSYHTQSKLWPSGELRNSQIFWHCTPDESGSPGLSHLCETARMLLLYLAKQASRRFTDLILTRFSCTRASLNTGSLWKRPERNSSAHRKKKVPFSSPRSNWDL